MKQILAITLLLMLLLCGCGEKKVLHCDGCGAEIGVTADSNVNEEWILYCKACEQQLPALED